MKSILQFAIVASILVSPFSYAHKVLNHSQEEVLCSFAPENDLKVPVRNTESFGAVGGLDEKTFNDIITKIETIYAPIVKAKGGKLKVNRKWTDATVNASATRLFKSWTVNMYGGMARYKTMTPDGFAMVMCHELGHHIGGFPRTRTLLGKWPSNEGQSDYFAAMKCFKRVFENDNNVELVSALSIPKEVTSVCTKTFKSQKEIALCQRSAMTGKILAETLWAMNREPRPGAVIREPAESPEFNTPTSAEVSVTDNAHPLAQCRLDTMLAGSVCGIGYAEDFAVDNAVGGSCAEEKGDKLGFRPHCWYKAGNVARRD